MNTKPVEDQDGVFGLTVMDDASRDILWESRTSRDPHEWTIGELVEHDGHSYTIKRIYGEDRHFTVVVDPA